MEVWVVVKMFQGVTDSVDVFTSRTDAYNELKKWIEEVLDEEDRRYVKDYGLEYTDVDGSDVHPTEIIAREGNLHSELLPLTPDETRALTGCLTLFLDHPQLHIPLFDSHDQDQARKIASALLSKITKLQARKSFNLCRAATRESRSTTGNFMLKRLLESPPGP